MVIAGGGRGRSHPSRREQAMSRSSTLSRNAGHRVTPTCPTCHRFLDGKLACWHCCDRPCSRCGHSTGSAFIAMCWPCWFQAGQSQQAETAASSSCEASGVGQTVSATLAQSAKAEAASREPRPG
jgi:hypothetical protein